MANRILLITFIYFAYLHSNIEQFPYSSGALRVRRRARGRGGCPMIIRYGVTESGSLTSSLAEPSFLWDIQYTTTRAAAVIRPCAVEDEEPHCCAQGFAQKVVLETGKMRVESCARRCRKGVNQQSTERHPAHAQ